MPNPNIRLHASKGGKARRRNLTRSKLDALLTPLESPADAKRRLEVIQRLVLEQQITTAMGSAATRTVEIWLRAEISQLDREKIKELEGKVHELMTELKKARSSSGMRMA